MVRAFSGGLLFLRGHDHFIAVRDFSGEAQLTPGASSPASLQMTIRADSLVETRDVFTEQQKQIINRELREIVLETTKYPEITFKRTDVTGNLTGGQFEAKIGGDLTLHGVTRHIVIPAHVTLSGATLRAQGEFTVKRSDYHVKATSALHGTIRVRDKLKLDNYQSGLVMANNTLFATTDTNTYAFDPATCQQKWKHHYEYTAPPGSLKVNHGVAFADGKVFRGVSAGVLIALDASTGKQVQSTGAPIGGGVITYLAGGKQYVAVAAGITSQSWKTGGSNAKVAIFALP